MKFNLRFFTSSLRRRISFAFLLVTALVLVMAVASYLQLRQIQPFSEQIIHNSSDLVQLQQLAAATAALDADLERYLVIRGAEYRENVSQDLQAMTDALTRLQSATASSEQLDLTELEASVSQLQTEVQNMLEALENDASSGQITRYIIVVYDEIDQLLALQQSLSSQTLTNLQTAAQAQSQIARRVLMQSVILGIIVVALTVFTTLAIDRRLRAIVTLTHTTTAISEGDLTRVAPVDSDDEIGTLATAFNTMTKQLRETLENLEQRVAERTRALETSTEVSRRLSTILDLDQLVSEVVEQLQSAFGYYHAHIYLFDQTQQNLIMAGGTGDAGRLMLARGHKIKRGQGLVGRAAENNQTILVPDVSQEPGWLPNDLLPETKAEVAVPIAVGGDVLGVLDVQQDVIGGLNQDDANLIQAIASQVAIAVQNAQAYERTQRRADRESQVVAISQRIQAASTIDEVLQISIAALGEMLGARQSRAELRITPDDDGGQPRRSA